MIKFKWKRNRENEWENDRDIERDIMIGRVKERKARQIKRERMCERELPGWKETEWEKLRKKKKKDREKEKGKVTEEGVTNDR